VQLPRNFQHFDACMLHGCWDEAFGFRIECWSCMKKVLCAACTGGRVCTGVVVYVNDDWIATFVKTQLGRESGRYLCVMIKLITHVPAVR
jgi:hypothetical protein